MKKVVSLLALLTLTSCVSPDWVRLIPENKDADITISTPYGTATVHTRVNPQGTNPLPKLPTPEGDGIAPEPVNTNQNPTITIPSGTLIRVK